MIFTVICEWLNFKTRRYACTLQYFMLHIANQNIQLTSAKELEFICKFAQCM